MNGIHGQLGSINAAMTVNIGVLTLLQNHLDAFKQREKAPAVLTQKSAALDSVPVFLNGRKLRDYQACF